MNFNFGDFIRDVAGTLTVSDMEELRRKKADLDETKPIQLNIVWDAASDVWAFDDKRTGLKGEPFVMGINEMIDAIVLKQGMNLKQAKANGMIIEFCTSEFDGYAVKWERRAEMGGGNWYEWVEGKMTGWLCPALYLYYTDAPDAIYGKVVSVNK
jgi:hypothetical protein